MPTEEKFTRKLRAILSADVKDYSLLMSDDEAFTVKTLKAYRALISEQIEQHSGRVVDSPGDNILAEFVSAVDAVECAVKIQRILKEKNEDLSLDKRLEFRIGVNIGDVIQDGGNLYGKGVNIAARIEGLADAGGVFISRNAYDHVSNKLNYGFEYLGEHNVKNIAEPVRVYKVLIEPEASGKIIGEKRYVLRLGQKAAIATLIGLLLVTGGVLIWKSYLHKSSPPAEVASKEAMVLPLPEEPSIAVMAFDNMGVKESQDFLSDAISESIITQLAKIPQLFVVARNSSFTYKDRPTKVQQIGRELGVRYILEGSIKRSNDWVRITAQLIEAATGKHLWAESYNRELKDIFAVQDEITLKIVKALGVKIALGEWAALRAPATENVRAWEAMTQAREYYDRFTKDDNVRARELAEQAVKLDPNYAVAFGFIGWMYLNEYRYGWGEEPERSFKVAEEMAHKALAINSSTATAYALLSRIYVLKKQYGQAVVAGERSIAIEPNDPSMVTSYAITLIYSGRMQEAVVMTKKAMRLHPYYPAWFPITLGRAYYYLEQYEKAIDAFNEVIHRRPDWPSPRIFLAAIYVATGKEEQAQSKVSWMKEFAPKCGNMLGIIL
jgi:adenylate cyclase